VINRQLDEAFNKHDAVAVAALFTTNATLVAPLGIVSGRDGVEKYFADVFQRVNPSDQLTKISYVYAFGGDLCAIGGRSLTIDPGRPGSPVSVSASNTISRMDRPLSVQLAASNFISLASSTFDGNAQFDATRPR
jgi:ketosteroid isomerase-like protein